MLSLWSLTWLRYKWSFNCVNASVNRARTLILMKSSSIYAKVRCLHCMLCNQGYVVTALWKRHEMYFAFLQARKFIMRLSSGFPEDRIVLLSIIYRVMLKRNLSYRKNHIFVSYSTKRQALQTYLRFCIGKLPRVIRSLQTPSIRVLIFFYSILRALPEATGIYIIVPCDKTNIRRLSRFKQESSWIRWYIYIYLERFLFGILRWDKVWIWASSHRISYQCYE